MVDQDGSLWRPDIHGAQHVANVKEWYNNTVAAHADEPGAPNETKTASSGDTPVATRPMPPAKLPEDWKPGETEAKAPPATDFDKQQAPVPYTGEFKDAQAYFAQRQGQPQIQMTPQIGKAAVEATAPPKDTGGERIAPVTPPADALPVRPAEPAITPPPATSPQTQYVPGGTLPQGNAPQQLADAAQGNSMALLSLSPTQPVDQLSTPLTQSIGAGSMSPIPWQEVQGWGWSPSSVDMGGGGMGMGGGGKFGGAGGFMGGGD